MDVRPIGMFDSGIGGLTVLKEIQKELPNEDIIYLGDTKRFPYGPKSKETIIEISKKCTNFLIEKNVKMIIIACGTATSQALNELKNTFKIPILGIIDPTVEYIKKSMHKNIGVIATQGSINSKVWENEINKIGKSVICKATPLLAPMAEEGWTKNDVAKDAIHKYLMDLKNIDALILGCTHYPLFSDIINEELEDKVEIVNMGKKLVDYIKPYLNNFNLQNRENKIGSCKIYLTDTETNFSNIASRLFEDSKIKNKIEKANI